MIDGRTTYTADTVRDAPVGEVIVYDHAEGLYRFEVGIWDGAEVQAVPWHGASVWSDERMAHWRAAELESQRKTRVK